MKLNISKNIETSEYGQTLSFEVDTSDVKSAEETAFVNDNGESDFLIMTSKGWVPFSEIMSSTNSETSSSENGSSNEG